MILSIETSTKACSIALHQEQDLVATQTLLLDQSHAELLMPAVEHMLAILPSTKTSLTAVAISSGPGSYTGLRIGASVAKGLCFALDLPLIAVGTLEAMAHKVAAYHIAQHWLCPMLDARRMEVYTLLMDARERILFPPTPHVVDGSSFQEHLATHPILFFGDGAGKCRSLLGNHRNAFFLEGILPSADCVGELAFTKWKNKNFVELDTFSPQYLKPFQGGPPKTGKFLKSTNEE